MTPAKFKLERTSTSFRARTKTFSGLGVPAFSTVEGTGRTKSTGLVVLKGRTLLTVAWAGSLAKIAVLIKTILPSV
jgi:hypothetical protein